MDGRELMEMLVMGAKEGAGEVLYRNHRGCISYTGQQMTV
jgi:hypothetical protein